MLEMVTINIKQTYIKLSAGKKSALYGELTTDAGLEFN